LRWFLITVTALGIAVAGLPATSASAAANGVITGTVTFHDPSADRTLQVFVKDSDGTFVENPALRTTVPADGDYSVQVPAGSTVKLRVSFAGPSYGYWFGDVFDTSFATAVPLAAGETVPDVNLDVPVPIEYSGRILDRNGNPIAGVVVPTTNTDGGSFPIVPAPVHVDASGEYQVFLPAKFDGSWYESGILAIDETGEAQAWLDRDAESPGGTGSEPNYYLNPVPGESHPDSDITLDIGSSSVAPSVKPAVTATKFRATSSPVVRGTARKGALLRTTSGRFNHKPTTLRYQWLRNGHAIRGATNSAYRLRKADVRKRISVIVTATRSGTRVLATSARTPAIRAH